MDRTEIWSQAQNVLLVRLDTIGDVLMTTPAFRALKESYLGRGQRRLTLLTSGAGAAIASLIPEIDEVIVYDAPWLKATAPRQNSQPEFEMIERLRRLKFDAAVMFTVFSQNPMPSAFMCYMANIPLRLAYCHENSYQMLTDWVQDPEPSQFIRHETRRHLDLVATIGCRTFNEHLSLRLPEQAALKVINRLHDVGVALSSPWLLVHPGATAPSRRYPPESFARVAQQLVTLLGYQVVFTGSGPEEQALVEKIRSMMNAPSYSLVNKLNLGEMASVISLAPLLVANNTGPVHMAAALGTPVVDIYALTNPQHTPWMVANRVISHDVPCKNCFKSVCPEGHHNCMRLIKPEEVVQAVRELLAETNSLQLVIGRPEAVMI